MAGQAAGKRELRHRFRPWRDILLLPLLSSLFFAASFPNPLILSGIQPLGFVALLPFLLSLRTASLCGACLRGAIFGAGAYALFNLWAFSFHPLAAPAIILVHALWMALLAPLLARLLRGKAPLSWLRAAALWTLYEWLKGSGWAGYPYGIIGYSQDLFLPLARSSGLWGVWGISFILAAASAWLSLWLPMAWRKCRIALSSGEKTHPKSAFPLPSFRALSLQGAISLAATALIVTVGAFLPGLWISRPQGSPEGQRDSLSVLVIQPNFPARKEGAHPGPYYSKRLLPLVQEGLADNPGIELIAMPETAYPPHLEIRLEYEPQDESDYDARFFIRALGDTGLPAIVGNDQAGYGLLPGGKKGTLHYNAALFLESGRVWSSYAKRRLVPFVESLPSPPFPPALWAAADDAWGPLWTAGDRISLFELDGLKIATPICYEDCFGSDCRDFVRSGADLIMSLSSDAWAASEAARRQHLACASFRALESGRPLLRVANDGVSALILPDGRRTALLPSSTAGWARADIAAPPRGKTPYILLGDYFPLLCAIFLSIGLLLPLLSRLRRGHELLH